MTSQHSRQVTATPSSMTPQVPVKKQCEPCGEDDKVYFDIDRCYYEHMNDGETDSEDEIDPRCGHDVIRAVLPSDKGPTKMAIQKANVNKIIGSYSECRRDVNITGLRPKSKPTAEEFLKKHGKDLDDEERRRLIKMQQDKARQAKAKRDAIKLKLTKSQDLKDMDAAKNWHCILCTPGSAIRKGLHPQSHTENGHSVFNGDPLWRMFCVEMPDGWDDEPQPLELEPPIVMHCVKKNCPLAPSATKERHLKVHKAMEHATEFDTSQLRLEAIKKAGGLAETRCDICILDYEAECKKHDVAPKEPRPKSDLPGQGLTEEEEKAYKAHPLNGSVQEGLALAIHRGLEQLTTHLLKKHSLCESILPVVATKIYANKFICDKRSAKEKAKEEAERQKAEALAKAQAQVYKSRIKPTCFEEQVAEGLDKKGKTVIPMAPALSMETHYIHHARPNSDPCLLRYAEEMGDSSPAMDNAAVQFAKRHEAYGKCRCRVYSDMSQFDEGDVRVACPKSIKPMTIRYKSRVDCPN